MTPRLAVGVCIGVRICAGIGPTACDGGGSVDLAPLPQQCLTPSGSALVSQGSRLSIVARARGMVSGANPGLILAPAIEVQPLDRILSITVLAFAPGSRDVMSFAIARGSQAVVDAAQPEFSLNRVLRGNGSVVAQLPVASALIPLTGAFEVALVRLAAATDGIGTTTADHEITVFAKTEEPSGQPPGQAPTPPAHVQRLPVQVVRAGGGTDTHIDCALAIARGIWRGAGIEIEETDRVSAADLGIAPVSRLTIDARLGNRSPGLADLLETTGRIPDRGLALFVVGDVNTSEGRGIWALSGGVPVPPLHGTSQSGIVASGVLIDRDPALAGQVIAHEIGHALGLFHTTEATLHAASPGGAPAPVSDQLDDTPACPAANDRNKDGRLDDAECIDSGGRNLMFWSVPRGAVAISAGQADIAKRSALTH